MNGRVWVVEPSESVMRAVPVGSIVITRATRSSACMCVCVYVCVCLRVA